MSDIFLEIIVSVAEVAGTRIESRDEVEDRLEAGLSALGFGEITGGGGGMGVYIIDVEVIESHFDEALGIIRRVLRELNVPPTAKIVRRGPAEVEYSVY